MAPDLAIDTGSEAADLGAAVHFVFLEGVDGRHVEIEDAAQRFNVDQEELERLCSWAWRQWESIRANFPGPHVEEYMELGKDGLWLTGHADLLSIVDDQVRVLDLKSGRLDSAHDEQLKGYAFLALQHCPGTTSAYVAVLRIRDQVLDGTVYTRQELDQWFERLSDRTAKRSYNAGVHCGHCRRSLECVARHKYLRSAVNDFAAGAPTLALECLSEAMPLPTRGQLLASVLERVKLVEDACELARSMVKADVAAHGGAIPTTDGRELVIVERAERRIDYAAGWPILIDHEPALPTDQLMQAVTINKGKVESAIKAIAPFRQKGAAVKRVMETLESAGAIQSTVVERLEVHRAAMLVVEA